MSFFTGFATGLAQSVDAQLQGAMAKRDEELTEAKKYALTMQRTKAERADEMDTRAKKALDRMIKEANGNVAAGLLAYNEAGGEPEKVESFLKDIDDTRSVGLDYNLMDKLKLNGVDLEQFKDLTRERAFSSIRTEISGAKPVEMQDDGLLSKIGLGMDNMGAGIADDVNDKISPVQREAIEGLTGAALDRSGMLKSEQYRRDVASALPTLKKQYANNVLMLDSGQDELGEKLTAKDMLRIKKQQVNLLSGISGIASAESTATGGLAGTTIASLYSKRLNQLETSSSYNTSGSLPTITSADGDTLVGPEASAEWQRQSDAMDAEFVRDSILDDSGNFVSTEAQQIAAGLGLNSTVESVRSSLTKEDSEPVDTKPASSPAADAGFGTKEAILANPAGYIEDAMSKNPSLNADLTRQVLTQYGVPADQIEEIVTALFE